MDSPVQKPPRTRRRLRRWLASAAVLTAASTAAVFVSATSAGASAADESALAVQWYDITNQTVAAAAFPEPVTESRTWAVSWLAATHAVAEKDTAPFQEAAFAQALHDTLAAQVPSRRSQLDSDLTSTLATLPDGNDKSAGETAGRQQAAAVLAERTGDGLDTASVDTPFTPPPAAPGVWQPTPPTFQPAIRASEGNAKPFLLAANNQFDPGPPPSLTSQTYLNDLSEDRAFGEANSTVRTPAQTDTAAFWEPSVNVQYYQVLREILANVQRPLSWDTTFVAAFHVVTTDGQIAIYNAKYEYLFWRPVTAIQTGSVDQDPSWTPFATTPRHPEYPSGHAGYAGAAEAVLTAFLGPNAPGPVSATSPSDPGSTHTYTTWSQVTQEIVNARVWEGVHFRNSDNTAAATGEKVGGYDVGQLSSIGIKL